LGTQLSAVEHTLFQNGAAIGEGKGGVGVNIIIECGKIISEEVHGGQEGPQKSLSGSAEESGR